jgi:hypothetical protein
VPAQLLRQLDAKDLKCPAAQLAGDASVHCKVEQSLINGRLNPESIQAFCCGEHTKCPSWRLALEAQRQGKPVQLEKSPREALMAELAKLTHAQRARVVEQAMRRKREMEAAQASQGRIWTPGPIRGRRA